MRLPFAAFGHRSAPKRSRKNRHLKCNCSFHLIECEIQQQHVDTRLPEEPKLPALGVLRNQLLHHGLCEATRPRHTLDLIGRRCRADVGIEPASGRRHEIDRDRSIVPRIGGSECGDTGLDCLANAGLVGPNFEPEDAAAL